MILDELSSPKMLFDELSGPAVVMLDDREDEIKSIENALDSLQVECEFIKVDIAEENRSLRKIPNIKLIFLDLHYGARFDPELCAQYISNIVPEEKQYYLVIWTNDPDNGNEVIALLERYNIMPINYLIKRKGDFREQDNIFNAQKLLDEIQSEFQQATDLEKIYGQVIENEDDHILINCLLKEKPPVFQVRRFDKGLFGEYIKIEQGTFLSIIITTKPGSRLFEFFQEQTDLSDKFKRPDYFEELGDISFLNDDNESNI